MEKQFLGLKIHAHIIDNILNNESIIKNIYTQLSENIIFLIISNIFNLHTYEN